MSEKRVQRLREFLDPLVERYERPEFLDSDPLGLVHRYRDTSPHNQEAVAVLCALLAYGNVKQIRRAAVDLLTRLESRSGSVEAFVRYLPQAGPEVQDVLSGWVHRFTRPSSIVALLRSLGQCWEESGSLGQALSDALESSDGELAPALDAVVGKLLQVAGPDYLLTRPADGSACKRWLMLCRWMGRKTQLDLGLWTTGSPLLRNGSRGLVRAQLLMPLDTHTGRLSRFLGFTQRQTLGFAAVQEVTQALRRLHPTDPVRYDFALSRLGILDLCQGRFERKICSQCAIQPLCSVGSSSPRSSTRS